MEVPWNPEKGCILQCRPLEGLQPKSLGDKTYLWGAKLAFRLNLHCLLQFVGTTTIRKALIQIYYVCCCPPEKDFSESLCLIKTIGAIKRSTDENHSLKT